MKGRLPVIRLEWFLTSQIRVMNQWRPLPASLILGIYFPSHSKFPFIVSTNSLINSFQNHRVEALNMNTIFWCADSFNSSYNACVMWLNFWEPLIFRLFVLIVSFFFPNFFLFAWYYGVFCLMFILCFIFFTCSDVLVCLLFVIACCHAWPTRHLVTNAKEGQSTSLTLQRRLHCLSTVMMSIGL